MRQQKTLRYSLTDPFGSQAVVDGRELGRSTAYPALRQVLDSFFGSEVAEACPACGWTASEATATSLMGCPACYAFIMEAYLESTPAIAGGGGQAGHQVS
ncbi:MAG: hypothetical protein JNM28_06660 [Armatimonadetes bacterium]|nr:hypothetical protein [Armatimonadota bacterium]MBS1711688.1 hypothetical protein [Armatimonadota bacterium]MBX3109757.1 hypothetical protein [Fimbriimonadaceae bacterium]